MSFMLNVANCKFKAKSSSIPYSPFKRIIVSLYEGSLNSMQFEHSAAAPLALDFIQKIPLPKYSGPR
jgi:hypothetical protein